MIIVFINSFVCLICTCILSFELVLILDFLLELSFSSGFIFSQ